MISYFIDHYIPNISITFGGVIHDLLIFTELKTGIIKYDNSDNYKRYIKDIKFDKFYSIISLIILSHCLQGC